MITALKNFTDREPVLFAGIMAALILGSAYGFQFAGYPPCELCWWQRYPYMAIIPLALIGHFVPAIPRKYVLFALACLFLGDAGIAVFHVGVEQRWWEGLATCSGFIEIADSVDAALDAIMNSPIIRCDNIAWSLFGISMAGYNAIAAFVMAVFCLKKMKKA